MTHVRIAVEHSRPAAAALAQPRPLRRIWEVDVSALLLVVPLVLGRDGMRRVLADHGLPRDGRDAVLAREIVVRSQRACSLAEEVERELDRRTARLRHFSARCPVEMSLAWWDEADAADRPALLWSIACDTRFDLDSMGMAGRR